MERSRAAGYHFGMARDRTPPPAVDLSKFVSVAEAAKLADVHVRHMRNLAASGRIPAAKVGRAYLVLRSAAAAYKRHPTAGRPRAKKR